MAPYAVVIEGLSKKFPTPGGLGEFTVIETLSLQIARGSFASIVGPSGCGKSTLLNIIAGIEPHDGGRVQILPQDGANAAARIGYVFQSPRLLNWLTVEENIKLLWRRRTSRGAAGVSGSESTSIWSVSAGRRVIFRSTYPAACSSESRSRAPSRSSRTSF